MRKSELPVGSIIKLATREVLCVKYRDSGDPGNDFRYVLTGMVCDYDSMHKETWDLVSTPNDSVAVERVRELVDNGRQNFRSVESIRAAIGHPDFRDEWRA